MASKKKGLDFRDLVRDEVTGDLPEQFLKWLEVEKHYSPNTVYQYRCDLKLVGDYSKAIKKDLQDLSYQNLFSYLRILKEKKGYQARTMARKIACMKSFYKWLVREKVLEHSPAEAIESPKLPKGIPMALNHDQMDQLLNHTSSLTYNLEGKRDNCLMHFLFYLGLRVSELSGLRLDNLKKDDQGGRYVQLYGKGNKERKIPLHREAERALELYLSMRPDTPHGYLFVSLKAPNRLGKLSVRSIQKLVVKYREKLSLPEKFTPHKGRHTFLSRLVQQGVDISIAGKLAGHANLQTTMGYLTFRDEDIRAAVDKL